MTLLTRLYMLARDVALGATVGLVCGAASAAFLWMLGWATMLRGRHEVLVWCLPAAGLVVGAVYERFGATIRGGNNLVIDTIHDGGPELPLRLGPMVLGGTVLTHLFGGSAGREGTAVQVGASLADALAHRLGLDRQLRRRLLAAGIAAGFGSVFGTPIAGAIFALELVVPGRIEYDALVPALVASIVADLTTRGIGIVHTAYPLVAALPLTPLVIGKWACFAIAVAAVATAFIELTHLLGCLQERLRLPLRMMIGGALVVLLWRVCGTSDYLGLGIPTIERAFADPSLPHTAFAWKLAFTAITLGAGFLGGEVTPLFFIGATLGAALSTPLGLPLPLACGVGLAAVFAAAASTPLALSIMAIELMGHALVPHVVIVCVLARWLTGRRSIYKAQLRVS